MSLFQHHVLSRIFTTSRLLTQLMRRSNIVNIDEIFYSCIGRSRISRCQFYPSSSFAHILDYHLCVRLPRLELPTPHPTQYHEFVAKK